MKLSAVLEYVVILEHVLNICMSWRVGSVPESGYAFGKEWSDDACYDYSGKGVFNVRRKLENISSTQKWVGVADRFLGLTNDLLEQVGRKERNGVLAKRLVIAYPCRRQGIRRGP